MTKDQSLLRFVGEHEDLRCHVYAETVGSRVIRVLGYCQADRWSFEIMDINWSFSAGGANATESLHKARGLDVSSAFPVRGWDIRIVAEKARDRFTAYRAVEREMDKLDVFDGQEAKND